MSDISIVIPTYHRKESLLRLLESIVLQKEKGIEIIIVEQDENNKKLFTDILQRHNIPHTYAYIPNPSTSKAKNIGIEKSSGEFIIFYDDDVVVTPSSVRNIVKPLQDPSVGGVAGRVVDDGKPEDKNNAYTGRISWIGHFSDGYSSAIPQDVDTVIGCNAAWRKETLLKVGGFDENFTGNAMREESDLSLRVKKLGLRIVFEPSSTVIHMRESSGGARKADNRLFWYYHFFSNEVYFFLKHRGAILLPFFLFTRISYILRCMFGFGREVSMRSVATPLYGIIDGVRKYYGYRS